MRRLSTVLTLLLVMLGCSPPSTCDSTVCAGCCREGVCLDGDTVSACGTGASSCDICVAGQECAAGRCTFVSGTGGGSGGGGGEGGFSGGSAGGTAGGGAAGGAAGGSGGGADSIVGRPCHPNGYCGAGYQCELISKYSISEYYCVRTCPSGTECQAGERCDGRVCKPDCDDNVFSQACTPFGGRCWYTAFANVINTDVICGVSGPGTDGSSCVSQEKCGPGLHCVGICRPYCNDTQGCGAGRRCYLLATQNVPNPPRSTGVCLGPCESGNDCTQANRSVCSVVNGAAVCSCDPGYVLSNGTCVSTNPCSPNPCTLPHKTQCANQGGAAVCGCDSGYVPGPSGTCVPFDPCSPNPCMQPNKTRCANQGGAAVCSCDLGYVPGPSGTCVPFDPCSPNPCTEPNKTVCAASGSAFTCSCVAGTTPVGTRCVPSCPNEHLSGDAFEPNECIGQAVVVPLTAAGSPVINNALTFAPTAADVDWFQVRGAANHGYVALVNGSNVSCPGFGGNYSPYSIGRQWLGVPAPWSCGIISSGGATSYTLAVLDYDLSDGDYPGSSFMSLGASRRWAANQLTTGDVDQFSFRISSSTTLRATGLALLFGEVTMHDPATGAELSATTLACDMTAAGAPCVNLTVSGGAVDVRVRVDSISLSATNLYRLSW